MLNFMLLDFVHNLILWYIEVQLMLDCPLNLNGEASLEGTEGICICHAGVFDTYGD